MAKVWTTKERYYPGVDSGDSRNELLILGGRSSIAKPFIEVINAEAVSEHLIAKTQQFFPELNEIEVLEALRPMRSFDPMVIDRLKNFRVGKTEKGFLMLGLKKSTAA